MSLILLRSCSYKSPNRLFDQHEAACSFSANDDELLLLQETPCFSQDDRDLSVPPRRGGMMQ
jgi:hypothetical protein